MGEYSIRLVIRPGEDKPKILEQIRKLEKKIFPTDDLERLTGTYWWLVYKNEKPIAFAGMRHCPLDKCAFFNLAGVLTTHRRKGLHNRLIRARLNACKRYGWTGAITYTGRDNPVSANALIAHGFRIYEPDYAWAGRDVIYFQKTFPTEA